MRDVLFILVIYGIRLEESLTYRSLRTLMSDEELRDCLYVHDNTENNIFLSGAYNLGLEQAKARNKQWMVLLDDDTELTAAYMDALRDGLSGSADVLVPTLVNQDGEALSPFYYSSVRGPFYGITRPSPDLRPTVVRQSLQLSAFNSATALRVSVLERIGGFSERYPMDYLDYWLYNVLHQERISIGLMRARVRHELSITDYAHVSRARYMRILEAECRFAHEGSWRWRLYYRLRLTMRAVKWMLTGHAYVMETIKQLFSI